MCPTVLNPTENDLEVPAPWLHDTEAIVIPAGGGVTVTPKQANSLKEHPVLNVRLEIGDDESSSLSVEADERERAILSGEIEDETPGDGDPEVDESAAGDDTSTEKLEGE